jgi:hypothetical protein
LYNIDNQASNPEEPKSQILRYSRCNKSFAKVVNRDPSYKAVFVASYTSPPSIVAASEACLLQVSATWYYALFL